LWLEQGLGGAEVVAFGNGAKPRPLAVPPRELVHEFEKR
jgi:hypothetical protein